MPSGHFLFAIRWRNIMKKSIGAKTIVYPTPVFVIGTYDRSGNPNLMTAAWGGICCSRPPCVAVSLRRATYTYGNLMHQRAFTVSIPSEGYVKEADYFGIVSGRSEDKFRKAGLTPVKGEYVRAPYVDEFPLSLECKLTHTLEIGSHTQFIGEILDVKVEPSFIAEKGFPNIEGIRPIVFAPDSLTYYGIGTCLGKAFSIGKQE